MKLFHIIDDVQVITRSRGVYRQVPLYRRGFELFAGHGGWFHQDAEDDEIDEVVNDKINEYWSDKLNEVQGTEPEIM